MTWQEAPTYVRAHALLVRAARAVRTRSPADPGSRIVTTATDLLVDVSLALSFREGRADVVRRADAHVVVLKVLLRAARDLGLVEVDPARELLDEVAEIGRMIGGWRRSLRRRKEEDRPGEAPDSGRGVAQ